MDSHPTFVLSSLLEDHPLQQGLRPNTFLSIENFPLLLEDHPLQQGLRRNFCFFSEFIYVNS